tara:strand:- start:300 stop:719 length:420 start_codon:yes stop_codon:yes gene_type:complete
VTEHKNTYVEPIFGIGSKVSLSFDDSEKNDDSCIKLSASLVSSMSNKENTDDYINPSEFLDKTWIQIGENERVFGQHIESSNEKISFLLNKAMVNDFLETKMLYAGVQHTSYNIKTREIDLDTVRKISTDLLKDLASGN